MYKNYKISYQNKIFDNDSYEYNKDSFEKEIESAIKEFENVNACLYSIETLMERIFDIKVSENVEGKFKQISK